MSFVPVLQYGIGLAFFGFIYWLMNGILETIQDIGIHKDSGVYDFLIYLWMFILLIYVLGGGWWLIRKYDEREYMQGGGMI